MISFLHTSDIQIEKFENLVRQFDKNIVVKHYVNEKLLASALSTGETDSASFKKQIEEIKKEKPSLLICTCSTLGEESDKDEEVLRIDRPIAEYIVKKYRRIGIVFAASSTKKSSENLLLTTAAKFNKGIEITSIDCSEYWKHLEKGNIAEYEKGIANTVKLYENEVDVFFIAQASMEGAKNYLSELSEEIVSSPEYGVREFMKLM